MSERPKPQRPTYEWRPSLESFSATVRRELKGIEAEVKTQSKFPVDWVSIGEYAATRCALGWKVTGPGVSATLKVTKTNE